MFLATTLTRPSLIILADKIFDWIIRTKSWVMDYRDIVPRSRQPNPQPFLVLYLVALNDQIRAKPLDRSRASLDRLNFHAFDVHNDQIARIEVQCVDRQRQNLNALRDTLSTKKIPTSYATLLIPPSLTTVERQAMARFAPSSPF